MCQQISLDPLKRPQIMCHDSTDRIDVVVVKYADAEGPTHVFKHLDRVWW